MENSFPKIRSIGMSFLDALLFKALLSDLASLICPSIEIETGKELVRACSLHSSTYILSMKISHKK